MDWRNDDRITPALALMLEKMEEEKRKNNGFFYSSSNCEVCGLPLLVKITRKAFRWESDITVTTFHFRCEGCQIEWKEHDSD